MSEQEQVTCGHVEFHDDMYPEFAPEQIVVTCDREAMVVWSDGGEPEWAEGPTEVVLCAEHAALRLAHYAGGHVEFGMYSLTPEHRALYLEGRQAAREVELTPNLALIASHEGIEEAGLLAREEHADPWDLGYTDEIERRVAVMVEEEELR